MVKGIFPSRRVWRRKMLMAVLVDSPISRKKESASFFRFVSRRMVMLVVFPAM